MVSIYINLTEEVKLCIVILCKSFDLCISAWLLEHADTRNTGLEMYWCRLVQFKHSKSNTHVPQSFPQIMKSFGVNNWNTLSAEVNLSTIVSVILSEITYLFSKLVAWEAQDA